MDDETTKAIDEKQKVLEDAIEKINSAIRGHVVTKDMDDREKQIWDICIGYCCGVLYEEIINLQKEKIDDILY